MMMCFDAEDLSDDTCSFFVWPRKQLYLHYSTVQLVHIGGEPKDNGVMAVTGVLMEH